jgi:hypothetical protein
MKRFEYSRMKWIAVLLALIAVVVIVLLLSRTLPSAIDWDETFYPVGRAVITGHSPYTVHGFYNPVWALIPIVPLAVFPSNISRAIYLMISFLAFGWAAYRLGARPLALGAFMASPPVIHCLLNANLDWMPLVGCVIEPRWGLFLVLVKPQMGIAMALFWMVEAWRDGGLRRVIHVFWPVTSAFALTLVVWGRWFPTMNDMRAYWWNASLWPASIPVGLALLVAALRTRRKEPAMAAGPCLSPYLLLHSWSMALASILSLQWETLAAVIGLWLLLVIRWQSTTGSLPGAFIHNLARLFV